MHLVGFIVRNCLLSRDFRSLFYSSLRNVRGLHSVTASQLLVMGRDSSVGIAARYGQDSPGIGSREIFCPRPNRPWGPPSLIYNRYRVIPGGKPYGAWGWPPTPTTAEAKERVELYLNTPFWAFMGSSRVKFTLPLPITVTPGVWMKCSIHRAKPAI